VDRSTNGTSKSHFKGLEPLEGQIDLHKKLQVLIPPDICPDPLNGKCF